MPKLKIVRMAHTSSERLPPQFQKLFARFLDYDLAITENGRLYHPESGEFFPVAQIKCCLMEDFDREIASKDVNKFIELTIKAAVAAANSEKYKNRLETIDV